MLATFVDEACTMAFEDYVGSSVDRAPSSATAAWPRATRRGPTATGGSGASSTRRSSSPARARCATATADRGRVRPGPAWPKSPGARAAGGWQHRGHDRALTQTDRTKLRRLAERGSFDRATANAIIDEAYLAHVGFVIDGQPRVLPMTYGRDGEVLYLHGAVGNAMLRASSGTEVCVTITLLDGLVLARSAFHHSMNYRSVVLLGAAEKVEAEDEKRRAFDVIVDHVLPGRSQVARPSNAVRAADHAGAAPRPSTRRR